MDAEYNDFFAQQAATLDQMTSEDSENAEFSKWMSEQFPSNSAAVQDDGNNAAPETAAAAEGQAPVVTTGEPSGGYSPSAIPFEHQERAYSPSAPTFPAGGYSPSAIPATLVADDATHEPPTSHQPPAAAQLLQAQEHRTATPKTFELQQEALQQAPVSAGTPNANGAPQPRIPSIMPTPAETPPGRPQASPPTAQQSTADSPPLNPLQAAQARAVQAKHDHAAWKEYLTMAENTADLDIIRDAYEDALKVFPNVAQIQIAYLNHYLHPALFQKAEALFARFLRPSPSVELWKFYLTYVRRINTNVTDPTIRDTVRKAYEFALSHVGHDTDAGQIWRDYIDFLKGALDARTTWDQQQKMDALRSAYHRAVVIPLDNVEALWRELDTYENSLNKITAKKFLQDLSPAYMTAKTTLRDLKKMLAPIAVNVTSTANPPSTFNLPPYPTWAGENDRVLTNAWKAYLKWEEGNPLVLEDQNALQTRIVAAYRKAVARMRFFPDIIYLAFHTLMGMGKTEEALSTLKQGIESNPTSHVLSFAYAEYQEVQKNFPDVHSTFDALIAALHGDLEKLEQDIEEEVASTRAAVLDAGAMDESGTPAVIEAEDRARKVRELRAKDVETAKNELGLVWIMLMRFARRSEGLKPARTVFAKARKDKWCAWIVYEAAALMEYHCTKAADVATKIFEIGLKQFGDLIDFVVRYLGFLISINDENNARALFERTITTFPGEKGRPLWERWARYEYHFSDLAASQKLEQRIAEALPNNPPIKQFAYKYTYLAVDAIASRDLGFGAKQSVGTPAPAPKPEPTLTPVPNPSLNLPSTNATNKRAASPARRRDPSPPPPKRFKGNSPPPSGRRDFDRDRGRDHGRRGHSPHRHRGRDIDAVPDGIVWFLSSLPSATVFDGPKFRTDDLMHLFKTANIPSGPDPRRSRSPPPARGGGRPPPDYTLGGTRGGRRF